MSSRLIARPALSLTILALSFYGCSEGSNTKASGGSQGSSETASSGGSAGPSSTASSGGTSGSSSTVTSGGSVSSGGPTSTVGRSGGATPAGGMVATGGTTSEGGTTGNRDGGAGRDGSPGTGGGTGRDGAAGSSGAGGAPVIGGATVTGGASVTGGATVTGGAISSGDTCFAEDCGTSCPKPTLPAPSGLKAIADHPDPFMMLSNTRISKKSEWPCRRAEIKAQLEKYESGAKPAVPTDNVTATFSGGKLSITVTDGTKNITFSQTITRPSGAPSGPIPLLIAYGASSLDASVFTSNGVATTNFSNDAMGAQSGGTSRGTGLFFDLYGKSHEASSMVAWAWGVSRIIDAIEKTPSANIDPKRVAVTGCSRNGKGAMMAGALDERIALTLPQESGAGGSASWRVAQAGKDAGENVQTLSNAAGEQPWFRADFGTNFGASAKVPTLPFDHHSVMGMVAPRGMFVIDNEVDWLGISSTFTGGTIGHKIYEALGVPDNMGYWQTTAHTHCQFPSSQKAMLDAFVKKFLVGTTTVDTKVLKADSSAKADLAKWMTWTVPTLQ